MARRYGAVLRQGADITSFANTTDNYDSQIYNQNIDNWMYAAAATTNYGNTQDVYVGHSGIGVARGLIRFTATSELSLFPDMSTREITATLYVYVKATFGTTNRTYTCYMLKNARRFLELESTWIRYLIGSNWTTAGAGSSTSDYTTSNSGSGIVGSAGVYHSIDVSQSIDDWINNEDWNYVTGWRLHDASGESSGTYKQLGSSETSTASQRPRLEIFFKIRNGRKLGMWNAQGKSMGSSRGSW